MRRNRTTWYSYALLSICGINLYSLAAALPFVQQTQNAGPALSGLHGTSMALGTLLAGLGFPYLARRHETKRVVWFGLLLMNVGLLGIAVTSSAAISLPGYGLASGCASLVYYKALSILSETHHRHRSMAISEGIAVGTVVGISASYCMSVLATFPGGWRLGLALPLTLTAISGVWSSGTPIVSQTDEVATDSHDGIRMVAARPSPRVFWITVSLIFIVVSIEQCFTLWAAVLFADYPGVDAAQAATALTMFTVGMALGRIVAARIRATSLPALIMAPSLIITLAGGSLVWAGSELVVGYTGFVLCGFGVAALFPMGYAQMAQSGGDPGRTNSVALLCTAVAAGCSPPLVGVLIGEYGVRPSFGVVLTMSACGLVLAIFLIFQHRTAVPKLS